MAKLGIAVIEVQECGRRLINEYLRRGYVLLAVEGISRETARRRKEGDEPGFFIRRDVRYVVGRPEGVEAWAAPAWEERSLPPREPS